MLCSVIYERLRLAADVGSSRQHRESIGLGFSLCMRERAGADHLTVCDGHAHDGHNGHWLADRQWSHFTQ
jgi:hypothetical protein